MKAKGQRRDEAKERYWQEKIRAGAKSGLSIRGFCRREGLKEGQFHSWRRELWRREQEKAGKRKQGNSGKDTTIIVFTNTCTKAWRGVPEKCRKFPRKSDFVGNQQRPEALFVYFEIRSAAT
jgi:hypothetical protein